MAYSVALLPGDGIGPSVTTAARRVLDASGVAIAWHEESIGESAVATSGNPLPAAAVQAMRSAAAILKGPVTTPLTGYRSVNSSLRAPLGLFAQVRPAHSLPGLRTGYGDVDCVVIRATNEDLYAGVEFEAGSAGAEEIRRAINAQGFALVAGAAISVKTCSWEMADRVSRFAFEWARGNGRQRVTIVHKATNVRHTDGLFLRTARENAADYPDLDVDDCLVDRAAETLVRSPRTFDVLLTQGVYGDILSDLCAGLIGGVGVAPSATYGDTVAVFEPVHGSAPKHAGTDRADPIATFMAAAMLLDHLGEHAAAARVRAAVTTALRSGVATYDLAPLVGVPAVSTSAFTVAVVGALSRSSSPTR